MNAWQHYALAVVAQITAITLLAGAAMACFQRRAALRHAIGVVALAFLFVTPIVTLLLPKAAWLGGTDASQLPATNEVALISPIEVAPPHHTVEKIETTSDNSTAAVPIDPDAPTASPPLPRPALSADSPSRWKAFLSASLEIWLARTINLVAVVWLIGAALLARRFFIRQRELRRFAVALETESLAPGSILMKAAAEARDTLGLTNLPSIAVSDLSPMPIVVGCRQPAVILPKDFAANASPERLRDVLIHECAHILRGDPWIHAAQQLAAILFWLHPAVHWLNRSLAKAREEVCDNFVLRRSNATDYAQTLLELSEAFGNSIFALSLGLFSRRWTLEERVAGILDERRPKQTRAARIVPLGAIASFVAICCVVGGAGASAESAKTSPQSASSASDPPIAGALTRLGTARFRPTEEIKTMTFLPGGKTLALVCRDGRLRHWDAETGELLREFSPLARPSIAGAACTADGSATLVSGWDVNEADRKMESWLVVLDNTTGLEISHIEPTVRFATEVAISPDRKHVVSAEDGKLFVRDAISGLELAAWEFERNVPETISFSPDGQLLAMGARDNVLFWKWASEPKPAITPLPKTDKRYGLNPSSIAFSPDGATVAVGFSGRNCPCLVDVATQKVIRQFPADNIDDWNVRQVAFSPNGEFLVAPISERERRTGNVAVWEVKTGKLTRRLDVPHGGVAYLSFSPDGKRLAGVGQMSEVTIFVWDFETGQRLGGELPGHWQSPAHLCFLADDQRLVSAGNDGTARVWDISKGRELLVLDNHIKSGYHLPWIRAMDLSPDEKYIATSSHDDTVRVFATDTGKELYKFPGHGHLGGKRAVRFTPDSKQLASWGDDMRVYRWDLATGKAQQDFRAQPTGVKLPAENRIGHGDPFGMSFRLNGAIFTNDVARLVALVGNAHVFEVATGKDVLQMPIGEGYLLGTAVSPDNKHLLTFNLGRAPQIQLAGGGQHSSPTKMHPLRLTDLANGEIISEITIPGEVPSQVAYFPDGNQAAVAVGSRDAAIYIVSIPDLAIVRQIAPLPSRVWGLAVSKTGKWIAAALSDSTISVWDVDQIPAATK